MPRKEEITYYQFGELSKEAKERAIKDWRHEGNGFDDTDGEQLTEFFKEFLEEKGFNSGVKVYWGLSYTQGDGVCFDGTVDSDVLFKEEGFGKYKVLGSTYIKVSNARSHQYCHWNSMHVEVEPEAKSYEDLIPKALYEEMHDWDAERERVLRPWNEAVREIMEQRQAPIRRWREMEAGHPKGVLEWMPGRPDPLDIPSPPMPELEERPAKFARAEEAAKKKVEKHELIANQLEEDVKEWVQDLSRELEKIGYDEIEYKESDEAIGEALINNEYEFTEDGERQ